MLRFPASSAATPFTFPDPRYVPYRRAEPCEFNLAMIAPGAWGAGKAAPAVVGNDVEYVFPATSASPELFTISLLRYSPLAVPRYVEYSNVEPSGLSFEMKPFGVTPDGLAYSV